MQTEHINGAGGQAAMGTLNAASLHALDAGAEQANRFYPEQLPQFAGEPTRDRFLIRHVGEGVGEGVVSRVAFAESELVFVCTGFLSSEVTQFSLQIAQGLHLHDPYFYGKLLHSCDPNVYVDVKQRKFIAVKPIQPGDFITMDYAQTEDYLYRGFPCSCGASNCRGQVLGRRQLAPL